MQASRSAAITFAEIAADAARSVPGVVDLDAGSAGTFATITPGRRIPGVRVHHADRRRVSIRVVVAYGFPLAQLATSVRAVVSQRLSELEPPVPDVDVIIADLHTDEGIGDS